MFVLRVMTLAIVFLGSAVGLIAKDESPMKPGKEPPDTPPGLKSAMWWHDLFVAEVKRANKALEPAGAKLTVLYDDLNLFSPPRRVTLEVRRGKTAKDELLAIDKIKISGIGFVTCEECDFPKDGLKYFESYCDSIVRFSFTKCKFEEGFFSRASKFQAMTNVSISDSVISAAQCGDLASIEYLYSLKLANTGLSNESAERLLKHPRLRVLDLSENAGISDDFIAKFAASKIDCLNVSKTKITSGCFNDLLKCKNLTKLTVSKGVFLDKQIDVLTNRSIEIEVIK